MTQSTVNLYNDDSLSFIKTMESDCVDLILTDPPYGMSFQSGRRKEKYESIKNDDSLEWLDNFIKESYRVLKDNKAFYCFCSWHNIDVFKSTIEKYFKIKNILIWVKNNHGSGDLKGSYAPKYEMCIYATKGRSEFKGKRYEDVMFFNKTSNEYHPTQKPIDMLEFLMLNNTRGGEIVFDPFMGSGSTGIACVNNNRKFIGIELDKNYFNTAKERIEKASNNIFDI